MLIAQISDVHLKPEGVLAYGVADTAMALARNEKAPFHLYLLLRSQGAKAPWLPLFDPFCKRTGRFPFER
ncbi:MAG: hypothetical protein DDT32_01013 [Syntrophomonadaceae bacterium]|nr:hypothetical protein [Bacillota bacterium]